VTKIKKIKHKRITSNTLKRTFKAGINTGVDIVQLVKLPNGEDRDEWIAMNTIELYNTVKLMWGIDDFCTEESCPHMTSHSSKGEATYLWAEEDGKTTLDLPAPRYIEKLFQWVGQKLDNEEIFPVDGAFPKIFTSEVKLILKRLFRVYAHIYYSHMPRIRDIGSEIQLHTCFKHFYYFVTEFGLVKLTSMEPLQGLINELIIQQ